MSNNYGRKLFITLVLLTPITLQVGCSSGQSSPPSTPSSSIVSVAVSPAFAAINTGSTQQFNPNVTGTGSFNGGVTWTASGGSINTNGLYTAPAVAGSYTVIATSSQDITKSGVATVSVIGSGAVTSVTVTPASASLATGGTQQFTAAVNGTESPSQVVTWTAVRGAISNSGFYTAPATSGADTVIATSAQDHSKAGVATLAVGGTSTVTAVAVTPSTATLATGGTQQFTAAVTGTGGPSQSVIWTANRGAVTSAGLYTAPASAGADIVTARSVQDTSKAGTAAITVNATPPTCFTLSASTNPVGGTVTIGAPNCGSGYLAGTAVSLSAPLITGYSFTTWTQTGSNGSFANAGSPTTTFTIAGNAVLAANYSQNSTVTSVTVSPSSVTLNVGSTQQFTAVVNGTGNPSQAVSWSATGGSISVNGLYTAPATTGIYNVIARSNQNSSISSSSVVTIVINSGVSSVSIYQDTVYIVPGAACQINASVIGDSVTNPNVNWSTTGGTINNLGRFVAPPGIGMYVVKATSIQDPTKFATATINVISILNKPPIFSIQPRSQNIPIGQSAYLFSQAIGEGNIIYQWFKNNIPIPNANENLLTINNITTNENNNKYYVIASNANGITTSNTIIINVLANSSTSHGFITIVNHTELIKELADPGYGGPIVNSVLLNITGSADAGGIGPNYYVPVFDGTIQTPKCSHLTISYVNLIPFSRQYTSCPPFRPYNGWLQDCWRCIGKQYILTSSDPVWHPLFHSKNLEIINIIVSDGIIISKEMVDGESTRIELFWVPNTETTHIVKFEIDNGNLPGFLEGSYGDVNDPTIYDTSTFFVGGGCDYFMNSGESISWIDRNSHGDDEIQYPANPGTLHVLYQYGLRGAVYNTDAIFGRTPSGLWQGGYPGLRFRLIVLPLLDNRFPSIK